VESKRVSFEGRYQANHEGIEGSKIHHDELEQKKYLLKDIR
jgi:hypothetical protein